MPCASLPAGVAFEFAIVRCDAAALPGYPRLRFELDDAGGDRGGAATSRVQLDLRAADYLTPEVMSCM